MRLVGVDSVFFAVWMTAPNIDQMRTLGQATLQHRDRIRPDKQTFINIVLDGTPSFSDEVRAEAARLAKRSDGWRRANAHVVELTGLRGIAVRSFMSTMVLLARPTVPTKVFDQIGAAARWLIPHLQASGPWTEEMLLAAYATARQAT